MKDTLKNMAFILIVLLIMSACGSDKKHETTETSAANAPEAKEEVSQKLKSVCIWDKGTIRETPDKKGKYVSAMSLGETINWLGKTEVDSADKNKTYYYVELSDGTVGWASEYVIAPDAKSAIATKEIPIYQRPDLLTITDKSFSEMDLVAVTKENDEWIEVVGKEKKKKGWIKSRLVSQKEDDIAVGLLATKALAIKDSAQRFERLNDIVENPSFANSRFMNDLKDQVTQEQINQEFVNSTQE